MQKKSSARRGARITSGAIALLVSGGLVSGAASVASAAWTPTQGVTVSAAALLKQVPVRAESNASYSRSKFAEWSDADRDGCDTREEVLIEEARVKPRVGSGCRLYGGRWVSVYDRTTTGSPSGLDIDHMVPLAEAWGSGARSWNAASRARFANDLGYGGSLIAVSASSNRSKSDRDPAAWMPTNTAYRCDYAKTWVATKWRWGLSADAAEKSSLTRALSSCRTMQINKPARANPVRVPGGGPDGDAGSGGGTDTRYATCAQAKAHGLGPYVKGRDREYGWYRDGDGDGIVCE